MLYSRSVNVALAPRVEAEATLNPDVFPDGERGLWSAVFLKAREIQLTALPNWWENPLVLRERPPLGKLILGHPRAKFQVKKGG